jgi:hypothetical protein
MPAWSFEHSVTVYAPCETAWRFWSDVANWAEVDPAVEWASLDGPFAAGTRGQTKPVGAAPTQWTLVEVEPARRAVIELAAPGAILRFVWMLSDEGHTGTRLTQRAELDGDDAAQYLDAVQGLEANIPLGMNKLVAAIEVASEQIVGREPR